MTKFMQILQDLLDDKDMTLHSLSKEINVPFQILYAYKEEDYLPSLEVAVKLAEYFNCSLNYLFGVDNYLDIEKYQKPDISVFYPRYLELLKSNNVSHYYLYKTIGLNNSSITKWKNGSKPKMESLVKIADYFGTTIDYLVGRSNSK